MVGLTIGVTGEENWHAQLVLHGVSFNVFGAQFDIIDTKSPEKKRISQLDSANANIEVLLFQEINQKIFIATFHKVSLNML